MINETRMKELAEKFASKLADEMFNEDIMEFSKELDMTREELEYFGWLCEKEELSECELCCYYDGERCTFRDYHNDYEIAPCDEPAFEEIEYDYSENMPCDTYGMSACTPSCSRWNDCQGR